MKKEKIFGIITSIAFFLVFFIWGTKGKFWTVFTAFYPKFHYIFFWAVLALTAGAFFLPAQISKIFNFTVKHRYRIFPALGFIFSALIAVFVFQSVPHVVDASHFLWTARVFIETGSFHLPSPELYEYYRNTFNVDLNGHYLSLFLPGFSIFLIPFELLGISFLFTPICNGVSVYLIGKIADRQIDDSRVSFFAMFFSVFSSFYLFMGASFMTHSFNLMLTLFAIYLVLSREKNFCYLAAGASAAIMLFIRPQNAFFVYVSILLLMLLKKKKNFIKKAMFFTAPFLGIGFLLMFYNWYYTGHPTLFPQDVYFSIREPYELCHRIGLGKGCPNTEGDYLPAGGLTMSYAFWVAFTRITLMNFNLCGHPLMFFFILVSFIFAFRKNFEVSLFFIVFFIGYYFFYLPGNLFGPRYFFEVASLLFIPAGYGFFALRDRFGKIPKVLIAAIPLSIFIFVSSVIMPSLMERFSDTFWRTDRAIEKAIKKENIKNSIIFIPKYYASIFLNLMTKPPHDDNGNLILLDLKEENSYACSYFMEKGGYEGAYIVDYYEKLKNKTAVTPMYECRRDYIKFEFEDKRMPLTGKPDYGVNFAQSEEEYKKFYPVKELKVDVSQGSVFAMKYKYLNDKSYYDFSHPILDAGDYQFTFSYVSDYCGPEVELYINGEKVAKINMFSEEQKRDSITIDHHFERGVSTFKLVPLRGNSCVMIDNVEMTRID